MINVLENIFITSEIEKPSGGYKKIHSNTSREQCMFLQTMFDIVKPEKSLEIGLAFGISALAILEKHKEKNSFDKAHIIIEPYPWDGIAEYNIEKEDLMRFTDIYYHKSEEVLPKLFYEGIKIQLAYVDTTKVFDTILSDFYFIDKIMDTGGIIIFDDCGGAWPGVQKVVRFISTLPNYKILSGHDKIKSSFKRRMAERMVSLMIKIIPFKKKFYPSYNFKSDNESGLNYSCLAFQKIGPDERQWNWDQPF